MVVSLFDLCRVTVQEGIESGKIRYVHHILSPAVRQSVLDMALMRGDISNPNYLEVLTSVEFLNGISSISIRRLLMEQEDVKRSFALQFWQKVADSLSVVMPDGKTLGADISKLELDIWLLAIDKEECEKETNFQIVVRLIAQCPNLRSLGLHYCDYVDRDERKARFNQTGPAFDETEFSDRCRQIMEGLMELSMSGQLLIPELIPGLTVEHPVLQFRNLASLTWSGCEVAPETWKAMLQSAQETLTSLTASGMKSVAEREFSVLPIPLPNLTTFRGAVSKYDHPDSLSIENLLRCKKLEYCYLRCEDLDLELPHIRALSQINCFLEIKECIFLPVLEAPGPSPAVALFGPKVTNVHYVVSPPEDNLEHMPSAVSHLVGTCENLTTIKIDASLDESVADVSITLDDWLDEEGDWSSLAKINLALAPLVRDERRASLLRKLQLVGNCDYNVLKPLFENCPNLESLLMTRCPQLDDGHLMEWASRSGGKNLSKLRFDDCINVSDDGLIPILNNSGPKMSSFVIEHTWGDQNKVTDRTWLVLIDRCRYLRAGNIPKKFKDLQRSKGFYNKIQFQWSSFR